MKFQPSGPTRDHVILLHGLGRTKRSMAPLAAYLESSGFAALNLNYPSTRQPIQELALFLETALTPGYLDTRAKLHFVTHSMGGIVLRQYLKIHRPPNLGRVVMLSPPNQGSEIVDHLKDKRFFSWVYGPAGRQLATGQESLPNKLGPVDFELGVITGTKHFNPLFSRWFDGPHDGKVAVARAAIEGMQAFLSLPFGHTFIMMRPRVWRKIALFLRTGAFGEDHAP